MKLLQVKTVWIFIAVIIFIAITLASYIYTQPYQFKDYGVIVSADFPDKPVEKLIENKFSNGIVAKERFYKLSVKNITYYLFLSQLKDQAAISLNYVVLLNRYFEQLNLLAGIEQGNSQPSIYDDFNGLSIFYTSKTHMLFGQYYLTAKTIVGIFAIDQRLSKNLFK